MKYSQYRILEERMREVLEASHLEFGTLENAISKQRAGEGTFHLNPVLTNPNLSLQSTRSAIQIKRVF